jgi:hypothetical protein
VVNLSPPDPDEPAAVAYRARNRAIAELPAAARGDLLYMIAMLYPDEFDRAMVNHLRPPRLPSEDAPDAVMIAMLHEIGPGR